MKLFKLIIFSIIFFPGITWSQADTTIHMVVEEMPRFPGCEHLDTTLEVKMECAEASLINFMYSHIQYPFEARQNGNEGMVVLGFIVEKDGFISNPHVVKDIGGGCGDEALRVLNGMNNALAEAKMRWRPGFKDGQPVRMKYNLPIRFRLDDPPDYVMVGRDSVYVNFDDTLTYKGGHEALMTFVNSKLNYPSSYKDSCFIGDMDIKALVGPTGFVKVLDVSDYFNLGIDFQFEAIQAVTSTYGNWDPAGLNGRAVPTAYDLTIHFKPTESHCASKISDYEKAEGLAGDSLSFFNEGKQEEGIAKITEAIDIFPENANYLYIRGQAYLALERMDEACMDLTKVKDVLSIGLVNNLLPIICKE